jgi:mRNA turnover protein 4
MFEVGNMRNAHLKTVRNLWKEYVITLNFHNESLIGFCSSTARIFFGRGAVMAKALGTTPEEEHRPGLHVLAKVRLLQVTP